MKYIRTKDNIVKHPHPNAEVFTFRYEIVKQADTIEKLCDQFVLLDHNKVFLLANNNFSVIRDIWKNNRYAEIYIYGAIWTDKGLIYVAKMNDKGELELLWEL